MPSNYNMPDPVLGTKDLDDEFITDSWLVEQYVGNTIWGTGQNLNGSLFLGVGTSKSSMTLGLGLNYTSVVTGNYYGMAIRNDGTLWACGYNLQGQLGIGTSVSVSSPVQVGTLTNWKQVSCSYGDVTMMVKTDGTLWGCGYSTEGQLGNGVALSQYSSPIQIGSLTNWKQVATSDATLAIKTDGTLWACGYGAQGQLGLGNTVSYLSPVQVGSLTNWKQVYTGVSFVAAIKTDGTLWAWGSNSIGQLGLGNLVNYSSPVQVGSLTNWRSLSIPAAGTNAMAAIKTDGTLWI
jgi:alpha-tubulin suppressor-like RCC1 family protein